MVEGMKYKNILWIEDLDIKDAEGFEDNFLEQEANSNMNREESDNTMKNKKIIEDYFGELSSDVRLISDYKEALEELKNDNVKYDLVVFDINMKNGMIDNDIPEIEQILKKKRVFSRLEKIEEFKETAGLYLYLFLLNCGYPSERMIILTGNGVDSPEKFLKEAHIYVGEIIEDGKIQGCSIIKEKKPNKDTTWLKLYYEDEYYQVRRLVYKACEYWKEKLQMMSEKEISFNTLYFNKDKEKEKVVKIESFINMLDKIELLVPTSKPQKPEKIYYHVLQVVSMFHEESADIKKLHNSPAIKKYHQSVRNFRNWSAHNKFEKIEIEAGLFMCIFCMALRTYFTNEDKDLIYEADFHEFIKGENADIRKQFYIFENKYIENWNRHFQKICNKDRNGLLCNDIDELLRTSGNCENKDMKLADSIFNLLDKLKRELGTISQHDKEQNILNYEITYKWNTEDIQNKYEQNELNSFEKCAIYYLLQ